MEMINLYLAGLPSFAMYMGAGVAFFVLFMLIYSKITPHHEWSLMMNGNQAAAHSFGGAIVGFTIPLYSAMSNSVSLVDFSLWAVVALFVQIAAFYLLRLALKVSGGSKEGYTSLCKHIENDHKAYGVLSAAVFIAVGLMNAASMTY